MIPGQLYSSDRLGVQRGARSDRVRPRAGVRRQVSFEKIIAIGESKHCRESSHMFE